MAQQPKSSFPTFETGTYEENGLTFFTVGSDGNPYYKVRADGSFFCNYNTYNGEEQGPPGSVAPDGLPLLVHAFGGDPGQLPAIFLDNGDPNPDALIEAERLIKSAAKVIDVYAYKREGVQSAWIQRINAATLPVGEYLFRPGGVVSRKGGEAVWYDGKWGEHARVQLTVDCNADGSPSAFQYSAVTVYVNKSAFVLYRALFPDQMAAFGDDANVLNTMETSLLQSSHYIFGAITEKEVTRGNRKALVARLDNNSLRVVSKPTHKAPKQTTQVATERASLWSKLHQAITEGCQADHAVPAFLPGLDTLTDQGKTWCTVNLKPIAKAQGIPTKFSALTDGNIKSYLLALKRGDLLGIVPEPEPEVVDDDEGDWD